eukprot:4953329-Alexandrium_andersonii.AAC.1
MLQLKSPYCCPAWMVKVLQEKPDASEPEVPTLIPVHKTLKMPRSLHNYTGGDVEITFLAPNPEANLEKSEGGMHELSRLPFPEEIAASAASARKRKAADCVDDAMAMGKLPSKEMRKMAKHLLG